jgi:hypothetical protein
MSKRRAALLAACLAATAPAIAQSGWNGIGQAAATPEASSVTITARGEARQRELMFCVEGHLLRINEAVLHYQGGAAQNIRLRQRVADGGCSRMATLSGRNRILATADVSYDPATLEGARTQVQIFVR